MRNDGIDFERQSAAQLSKLGWECRHTPTSGDFGADLICKCGNETLVVQCKDYSEGNSIGVAAVQETSTAKLHYRAEVALLLFQGRLTPAGQKLAKSVDVKFAHISELVSGCALDRTEKGAAIRREEELSRQAKERRRTFELRKKENDDFRSNLAQYKIQYSKFENDFTRSIIGAFFAISSWIGLFVFENAVFGILSLIAAGWFVLKERTPPKEPIAPRWMTEGQVREAYKAIGLGYRGAQGSEFLSPPPSPPPSLSPPPSPPPPPPRLSPSPMPSMHTNRRYATISSENKSENVIIDIWQCLRCQKKLNLKNTIGTFQMKCPHCGADYIYDRSSYKAPPTIIEKW